MKILLINPPHLAIGSRMAGEHLPPLGLLAIGGPLIDAGHQVQLLDADFKPMTLDEIVQETIQYQPNAVLMGHSGSTSAQPVINEIASLLKQRIPSVLIIIGGVFPTYHWQEILHKNPAIDFVVCSEGEETTLQLITAISLGNTIETVKGIALRLNGTALKTATAPNIQNLDAYRIGWELMGKRNYTYWGHRKAVVIQFSRGCPYPCSYCGQSLFWKKWRHRDPQLLADEMEMLHHKFGIEVFNFADENPSTNKDAWKAFLEALIEKKLSLTLVGSIRADNIVRDHDILHLYKQAGFERFLLGIENYDENILKKIKKAGTITKDREAIQLLRKHGILSMATYVVGFGEERLKDFYYSLKQLLSYDPDQIQLLYATPHQWTPYFEEVKDKEIIQLDQRRWDYKHQILATKYLHPLAMICLVKLIEVLMQARPKALFRVFFHKDPRLRKAMQWYTAIGRRVWLYELFQFIFKEKRVRNQMQLHQFWE